MQKLLLSAILSFTVLVTKVSADSNNKVFINLTKREICSQRLDKCFPIAIGSAQYPSPKSPGPHYVLDHRKNGFDWVNPLNGKLYPKGTHNLGDIWITVLEDETGIYGIHTTPDQSTALEDQWSHGCFRMYANDLQELSDSIMYFDEIYINW